LGAKDQVYFTHPLGPHFVKTQCKIFSAFFLATNELGDLGIDLQRLQISQKETNMCLIMEGHNPTYELVLFPTPLPHIEPESDQTSGEANVQGIEKTEERARIQQNSDTVQLYVTSSPISSTHKCKK